jgi:hypothetical protein
VAIGVGWSSSHHTESSGEIRAVVNLQQNLAQNFEAEFGADLPWQIAAGIAPQRAPLAIWTGSERPAGRYTGMAFGLY